MLDNNDVPIDDSILEEDVPLESIESGYKPRPEELNNMHRGHAAVLTSELEGINVFDAYTTLDVSKDPRASVGELSVMRSEQEQKELTEYFNENLGTTPEDVVINTQVYESLIAEEQAKKDLPERQVVESFSGLSPDEQALLKAQAELELINVIEDITKDYTTLEKALDIGKAFLPTGIFDNKQIADSFFNADDYLRDVIVGMKDLRRNDPEKFQRILPGFVEELQADLPKNKQLTILTAILSPHGEEELDEFGPLGAAIDTLDLATLGGLAAIKVAKIVRANNAIRLAKKLDNTELATDVNTAALTDDTGEAAANAGISRETAHANSAPFDVSDLDEAYIQGLSGETVAKIAAVRAKQKKVSEIIRSREGILREGLLESGERAAAEERVGETLRTEGIEDFSVVGRTDNTTTFKYRVLTPKTGKPMVRKGEPVYAERTVDFTLDDVTGVWKKTEEGMVASWLKSPTVFAKWAYDSVRSALRLDSSTSNVQRLFQALQVDAMAPILGKRGLRALRPKARRELAELDDVLRAGDEWKSPDGTRGKVFSVDELRGGLVNGVKMNDRQIETYYNLRGLYDELWTIRNDETRNTLNIMGKKEIKVAGTPQIGKPYTREGATGTLNASGIVRVYDSTLDEVVELSGREVSQLYDEGHVLAKLDNEIKIPNGNHGDDLYDLVVVDEKIGVQGLPQKVLHFREGYVPKVNIGAYWFAKRTGTKTVNGVVRQNQVLKTERMFASKTEAEKWMASLSDKERKSLQLLPDRALEQEVMGSSQIGSGGGLYTGPRASEDIPFGADGVAGERLNTYEALGQNLQALENYVTRNEWRMGMQQRWINSAKAAGFNIDRFEKALIPEGDPRGKGLRKFADQIEIWSGFPTASEMRWDGFVSGVMEWALNSRFVPLSDRVIVRGANYLRHKNNNPVNFIRNTAFHSLLGVFNPAQLWVQAQGAAIAFSLSNRPMEAFRMQNALVSAIHAGIDSKTTQAIAKAHLVDHDTLKKLLRMWDKTGLESSVVNTADHVAASRGLGVGREALRKAFDKGLLFYRMGELFNRRYSFVVAAQRKFDKLGHYDFTDDVLKEVLTDANNMMLNLSRANRAAWQRGVVAIPTQFLQVQAKLLETLWGMNKVVDSKTGKTSFKGSNLSFGLRERGRILAGQVILYGAAGIPLGNLGVRWAAETLGMNQYDVEELANEHPIVYEAINNGLWGVYAHHWLGADVDLSNRGAIAAGMTEFTLDLMFSEATIGEKLIGAFGTVPHRAFKAWKVISPMILSDSEETITGEELARGLNALASISSTWSNAHKGYVMHRMHQLLDTRGNVVEKDKDYELITEFMTMLGFQPSELKRTRDRETLVRARKKYRGQVTTDLVNHYWEYVMALKGADSEKEQQQIIDRYAAGTKFLMASLRNEGERQKVREALNKRLERTDDKKTRTIREFIEEFSDGQVLAMGSLVASMQANGLISNEIELPEEDEE